MAAFGLSRSARPARPAGSAASTGLLAVSLLGGCTLVLGDIPSNPIQDDAVVGADSGSGGPGGAPGAGGWASGGVTAFGGAAGTSGSRDEDSGAAGPPADAAPDVRHDSETDAADASARTKDATIPTDAPCHPQWWYIDEDMDGYGRSNGAIFECAPPTDTSYSPREGDCNDGDANAFPGQRQYFGFPHTPPGAPESFDFDCSGDEAGDPLQPLRLPDCGLLDLLLCGDATGYAPRPRSGVGINSYCGSTTLERCVPRLLECQTTSETVPEPYRCR